MTPYGVTGLQRFDIDCMNFDEIALILHCQDMPVAYYALFCCSYIISS